MDGTGASPAQFAAQQRDRGHLTTRDNALAESFFASIKGELLDLQAWPAKAAARHAIVEYTGWYNGTRLHSTLGYRSPAEYEAHNKIKKVA
jgi:transposase InsO family protein